MKTFPLIFLLLIPLRVWGESSCEANYDELGIVHQSYKTQKEYYFCFGFHHGQDRAWQMDFFRRLTQGRNAEVLGYKHIKNDFMMRLLDLPTLAQKLYQDFPENYKDILKDYSAGVNVGFTKGKEADEFIRLGYSPEVWRPEHSVAVMLLQSFDQTKKTFFLDIKEEEALQRYPDAQHLFSEYKSPWFTTILKTGEYQQAVESVHAKPKRGVPLKLWANFPELFGKNSGSNNWVLAPERTKNNFAILANDPHLDLKTPLFWYWIHLKGDGEQSIGATLPGLPFIASGTNGKISWGLTNSYLNSADSVEINDLNKKDLSSQWPIIWFKLGFLKLPFFFKSIEKFKDIYPVLPLDVLNKEKIVLRWTGYGLSANEVTGMFDLHKKKSAAEAHSLLSTVGVPSWNYVFADTQGEIGFSMVGRTYQNTHDPFAVSVLSTEEFLNPTILNSAHRPQILAPERAFIVTANNQHWPKDSLYKGGGGYSISLRAKRIEESLLLNDKHDLASTQKIQCDLLVKEAEYFIPLLQKFIPDLFPSWNHLAADDSKELSIYRRLLDLLMKEWEVNESALYLLLENGADELTAEVRSIYQQAIEDVEGRSWGSLAKLNFEHLSGDAEFKYSPELSGLGDKHTVGPGTTKWDKSKKEYHQFSGASMRMIIEMSNPVKILLNLPGKNRLYQEKSSFNPWQQWRECKFFEVSL